MFEADLGGVDVVALFLLPHVNRWLEGKLRRELRPGSRVVGHQFAMKWWQPAETIVRDRAAIHIWRLGG